MYFCFVQRGVTARVETIAEGHVIIELVKMSNFCYAVLLRHGYIRVSALKQPIWSSDRDKIKLQNLNIRMLL